MKTDAHSFIQGTRWPMYWPRYFNACTDPCDNYWGHCCCGAYHGDLEFIYENGVLWRNGKQVSGMPVQYRQVEEASGDVYFHDLVPQPQATTIRGLWGRLERFREDLEKARVRNLPMIQAWLRLSGYAYLPEVRKIHLSDQKNVGVTIRESEASGSERIIYIPQEHFDNPEALELLEQKYQEYRDQEKLQELSVLEQEQERTVKKLIHVIGEIRNARAALKEHE